MAINFPWLGLVAIYVGMLDIPTAGIAQKLIQYAMLLFSIWQLGSGLLGMTLLIFAVPWAVFFRMRSATRTSLGLADIGPRVALEQPSRRQFLSQAGFALAAMPFAAASYGAYVAREEYELVRQPILIENLPPPFDGYTILQLTDIHAGLFMTESQMEEFVSLANGLNADLIALTGDYVSYSNVYARTFLRAFGKLRAREGVVAIWGNHDVFTDSRSTLAEGFRASEIKLLDNESMELSRGGDRIHLAGVDYISQSNPTLSRSLKGIDLSGTTILLSHQPNVLPDAERYGIDLQLSGHTHGGQMKIEFLGNNISPARLVSQYTAGLYRSGKTQMYLSRGIGTTGVPIRWSAMPEVTLLTLRRA